MARMLFYAIFATLCASVFTQNKLPPIVVPKSGDVWTAGERQTVKWSTDGFNVYDPSLTPLPGIIYIGHLTETAQQIWFNAPLAQNFTLADAQVDVIVPALPTAKNYFLVLFGSSDNWSQFFTLNNPADPRGTGTFGTTITYSLWGLCLSHHACKLDFDSDFSRLVLNLDNTFISTTLIPILIPVRLC
ncbi:hypothetical protein GSI_10678 [Ganoderma sinense ZZ0214-1]|uniref:Transporter n=1 Tax=Ganoderma sinense ZZ0214-1 TaxID=1077348 RepID=A0A2G8S1B4_9APHY|nr:hypothetical protein GSI_10678 [Ganoderma sinense ZZ0214-1]